MNNICMDNNLAAGYYFLNAGSIIVLPDTKKYRVEYREWFMYQGTLMHGWCISPLGLDAPQPLTSEILNSCTMIYQGDGPIVDSACAYNIPPSPATSDSE